MMSDIPSLDEDMIHQDLFVDEPIFLILSMDPWYGDIIIYLQTLKDPPHLLGMSIKDYIIILRTTSLLVTLCIFVVWIPFRVTF